MYFQTGTSKCISGFDLENPQLISTDKAQFVVTANSDNLGEGTGTITKMSSQANK